MKRMGIIIAGFLVAFVVAFYAIVSQPKQKGPPEAVVKETQAPKRSEADKIMAQARNPIETKFNPELLKVKEACRPLLSEMALQSMSNWWSDNQSKLSTEVLSCLKSEFKVPIQMADLATCQRYVENSSDEKAKSACFSALMFYRARVVALAYADRNDVDKLETPILVNKILNTMLDGFDKMTSEKVQAMRAITAELLKRMPESVDAVKAHLMTYFADFENGSISEESESYGFIKRGLELNPNEEQLRELQLYTMARSTDGFNKLYEFVKKNPGDALGFYHLAHEYWKSGDRAYAIASLESALRLSPQDTRIQQALSAAKNPKNTADSKIFNVTFGFRFDDPEL